jgi:hypothetical protein
MDNHLQFTQKLQETARAGNDLIPIINTYREHIIQCNECRKKMSGLFINFYSKEMIEEIILDNLDISENQKEPPYYPAFTPDKNPEVFWKVKEEQSKDGKLQIFHELKQRVKLTIKINIKKAEICIDGLPSELSRPFISGLQPVPAQVRGDVGFTREKILSIPDSNGNLTIHLSFEPLTGGKSHLHIEIHHMIPDRPVDYAQISLQGGGGKEVISTHDGKATFLNLIPSEYGILVKVIEKDRPESTWHLTFNLQPV